jgi:hypothetical protein
MLAGLLRHLLTRLRCIGSLAAIALSPFPLFVTKSSAASSVSRPAAQVLSETNLLARLTDPAVALSPLPSGVRVTEVSSHDLLNGNLDGGSYGPTGASPGPSQPLTYVRREDGAYVLLDQPGPGCLVRLWMTGLYGDLTGFGRLQVFFDGRSRPSIDESATRVFGGQDRRFPRPLVDDWRSSSGGNYSYVPLCFARQLKVRVSNPPWDGLGYYQLTLLSAPLGTPVKTFADGRAGPAAATLARLGAAPITSSELHATRQLRARHTVQFARLRGAGTIRYLRLRVTPFNERTLQALWLRVAVDGLRRPQIDVPLGSLFGDGIETRMIHSRAFGMSPPDHTGYFALPIPYRAGASVSIRARVAASVTLDAWNGAPSPEAGTLFGQRQVEHTTLGRDYGVLNAGGSGRVASLVDEVLDGGRNDLGAQAFVLPDQAYMEGDDRVYVDGSRSPAIYGTGTEDIFNGGWYFNEGAFSLPMSGAGPLVSNPDGHGARAMYRVFADDGVRWGSQIRFGIQHGAGDDRLGETVAVTTFSYRWPQTLLSTDQITFAQSTSRRTHNFAGRTQHRSLRAYFEGVHNGNSYLPTQPFGVAYPAPPPDQSRESYAAQGIGFTNPISFSLRVNPRNVGVVLRRLEDQSTVAPVAVTVDGRPAGLWAPNAFPNPAKRWLETDFDLPPAVTARKHRIRVGLIPIRGTTATAYELRTFSRVAVTAR